jgi:hypothetical protein
MHIAFRKEYFFMNEAVRSAGLFFIGVYLRSSASNSVFDFEMAS